jgi:L-amino acid N-acyltransferase YncA
MTVTYQVEPWQQYYSDPSRESLWREHYAEFEPVHRNKLPFAPDEASYCALDRAGMLSVIVARRSGKMIGYCLVVIRRHLHYASLCAFEDSYYLTAGERHGWTGYKLLAAAVSECKRRGAVKAYFMTKEFVSMAELLSRLGMAREDSVFTCWLEDM